MGDVVNFKELQEMFDSTNKIVFKLYSLEYVIEKDDNFITAYAKDYSGRKKKYNTFKETMNNFKIYTEPLINQIDKIEIIEDDGE